MFKCFFLTFTYNLSYFKLVFWTKNFWLMCSFVHLRIKLQKRTRGSFVWASSSLVPASYTWLVRIFVAFYSVVIMYELCRLCVIWDFPLRVLPNVGNSNARAAMDRSTEFAAFPGFLWCLQKVQDEQVSESWTHSLGYKWCLPLSVKSQWDFIVRFAHQSFHQPLLPGSLWA